jgi:hypothetical protein
MGRATFADTTRPSVSVARTSAPKCSVLAIDIWGCGAA